MTWKIEFERAAAREFRKLDQQAQRRIRDFFHQSLLPCEDPRALGKALSGMNSEFWRYRIGPYRVIATIQDERMVILLVRIGHRREVYR
ncbi:MAG: type II toxin-antitoxin system RelE/ParE family toxin [Wenzhouxiangella sp.]|nr:type II toxin-antitoxin system RelE/ParE family toxin [Wenzhouxiangella sp.]